MIARMALLVSGALLLGGSAAARESNPALGVEFHCNWGYYTDGTRATVVDRAVGAGLTWVRIDVSWRGLEPHRRKFAVRYGTRFERCVALAKRRGLRVLVVLGWTPKWANGGRKTNVPPRRASDYGVIATRLATRLRGRVDAWEVWNEPNLVDGWTGTPETYAQLLHVAYQAFKRGDPHALVVLGGISGNDDKFIGRIYAAGAKNSFDVVATHPYQGVADAPPEHADDGERWWITHVDAVRALMVANGDGAKPIWFTEVGWSAHANAPGTPPYRLGVTEAQQADYATRLVRFVRATYPYVTQVFWYDERTRPGERDLHLRGFGLLRADLSPRPVLFALRDA